MKASTFMQAFIYFFRNAMLIIFWFAKLVRSTST